MAKCALITGVTGQDGAYLAKLLLDRGYRVVGASRQNATPSTWRLNELGIANRIERVPFELLEPSNIRAVLRQIMPDEIYNLAAQSFVQLSFDQPEYTSSVDALGVLRLLEAMREVVPEARFYQASTSEMFGNTPHSPQDEQTPFHPRSPYAIAKVFAHWTAVNYREAHGMFCTSGILFNHESPLRGAEFLTRKVSLGLARLAAGTDGALALGNLDSRRDWGFAGDYVEGMHRMLQADKADDFVLATGRNASVREFTTLAAEAAGRELEWDGEGIEARGIDRKTGQVVVKIDPRLFRPAEVNVLLGNYAKAKRELGWETKVSLEQLIEMMVEADMRRVADGTA